MHTKFTSENLKGKGHAKDLGVDRKIIMGLILGKQDSKVWAGFIYPRIGTTGGLL
jgi:hypothetical protein